LLLNPPSANIYRRVESRIITTFAVFPEAKLRNLLKGQVFTDGKPSLILSRLRNLNDGACDHAVIRSVFSDSSMESDLKRVLASVVSLSEKLARLEARNKPRPRSARRSVPNRNRGRSAERTTPRLCVAHSKYPENPTS
ncbi:hypothetical protein WN55_06659, partial [Dufourea novaeangliae]